MAVTPGGVIGWTSGALATVFVATMALGEYRFESNLRNAVRPDVRENLHKIMRFELGANCASLPDGKEACDRAVKYWNEFRDLTSFPEHVERHAKAALSDYDF